MCAYPTKDIQHYKGLRTPDEVEKYVPGFLFSIDCTEQPIPRPIDNIRKRIFYSGKKKTIQPSHRLWLTIMELSFIKHATRKEEGMATIFIRKIILSLLKKGVVKVVDLGYLGIEKDFPEQLSSTPHRKKRNLQYLSKEQKEYNQGHVQKRIVIEHIICRLKKYSILADVFKNKLKKYNKVSDIVNYRIMNHHN